MTSPSRLDRALDQYTRATARIDAAARSGKTVDVTDMAATRGLWEAEARALGASDAALEAAGRAGIKMTPASPGPLIFVEVASIDQHGDPGFVHYRGDFYTPRSAGAFALSQAAALSIHHELERISVSINTGLTTGRVTELEFMGTPVELAVELASNPKFASSARRAGFPAPEQVTAAAERIAASTPSLPEAALDNSDALVVEVHSMRPNPLPNTTTEVGFYNEPDAFRIADELAGALRGEVQFMRAESVLRVTHAADLADLDRAAVERFERVNHLRANLAVLDPVADAEHIAALSDDIAELRARVPAELDSAPPLPRFELDRLIADPAALLEPSTGSGKTAAPVAVTTDSDRPQRLVYSSPSQVPGYVSTQQVSTDLPPLPPVVRTNQEHGLG